LLKWQVHHLVVHDGLVCKADILEMRPRKVVFIGKDSVDHSTRPHAQLLVVLLPLILIFENVILQIRINNEQGSSLGLKN